MRCASLFLVIFLSSACTTNYKPSQASPISLLGRDEAEIALIRTLRQAGNETGEAYEEVMAGDSRFRFSHRSPGRDEPAQWSCPYAGTPAPDVAHVTSRPGHDDTSIDLALGGCAFGQEARRLVVIWDANKNEIPDRFADALFALAHSESTDPAQDPEFQKVVRQYRDARGGLPLSEAVRPHRVAAEEAVREKRFEDAVNEYGEALKLAPWWPQGHYNRALILSEIGAYGAAGREMKRYLLLEPEAENARKVQDKIYAWQAKVK